MNWKISMPGKKHSQPEYIGMNVRRLREARGLSIRSLSEICGLAVNTLSLIENMKTSPSINTLAKIAEALEIPITAFFGSAVEKRDIGFSEKKNLNSVNYKFGNFFDLGSQVTSHSIGPYIVNIDPNSTLSDELITHPGYEFILCMSGCFEYVINRNVYLLENGDSLLFDALYPHKFQNTSCTPSQFLLILYPLVAASNLFENHIAPRS